MDHAAQGIIDAHGVEQGERARRAIFDFKGPVRDFVADGGEQRHREKSRELGC
jgi:hypothetical protein